MPLVTFYTPWKHKKTIGFVMFSGGTERDHDMDWFVTSGLWLSKSLSSSDIIKRTTKMSMIAERMISLKDDIEYFFIQLFLYEWWRIYQLLTRHWNPLSFAYLLWKLSLRNILKNRRFYLVSVFRIWTGCGNIQVSSHIEPSEVICSVNELTGIYLSRCPYIPVFSPYAATYKPG